MSNASDPDPPPLANGFSPTSTPQRTSHVAPLIFSWRYRERIRPKSNPHRPLRERVYHNDKRKRGHKHDKMRKKIKKGVAIVCGVC